MARRNPGGLKAVEFKDKEELRLELERILGWAPGWSMKPGRPAAMILAPHLVSTGGAPETTG